MDSKTVLIWCVDAEEMMAGRYSSVYFPYLKHNVSVRTGSFLVQSKRGSSKSRTGPVWTQVSQGNVHHVSMILWCAQDKVFMLCAGDQGRKKSCDTAWVWTAIDTSSSLYISFWIHFCSLCIQHSFTLAKISPQISPTSLLSFLTSCRFMSHSFRSHGCQPLHSLQIKGNGGKTMDLTETPGVTLSLPYIPQCRTVHTLPCVCICPLLLSPGASRTSWSHALLQLWFTWCTLGMLCADNFKSIIWTGAKLITKEMSTSPGNPCSVC